MTVCVGYLRYCIVLPLIVLWAACHQGNQQGVNSKPVNAEEGARKLVLVSLDGVRWQEVFAGVDRAMIEDNEEAQALDSLTKSYWREEKGERRKALFPFLWSVIESQGVLVGDRNEESFMEVSNGWWLSYAGYNEILTGRGDPSIDSNEKKWNPNITFLEILGGLEGFRDSVLTFASWDVFPFILNVQRSRLPVNAGFSVAAHPTTERARWLNEVSAEVPRLWKEVRLDFLTHGYAMEALKSQRPRVMYVAYGETDDFAHDGSYDRYIDSVHRTDQMISELWETLQSDPFYRDQTDLIITTDHGRGASPNSWTYHSSIDGAAKNKYEDFPDGVIGSNEIWFAAIGPNFPAKGLVQGRWTQSQIAATVLTCLQQDPVQLMPLAGQAMTQVLRR